MVKQNKNITLATVVIVSLVVAVIASVVTLSVTGNTIKVRNAYGGTEIYTKAEVDNKLSSYYTKTELSSPLRLTFLSLGQQIDLSSDFPTKNVVINGGTYTVELMQASDSAATIKVNGGTPREINEGSFKLLAGSGSSSHINAYVLTADETNLKLSVSVVLFE
ncbi:MAG: hypothetical protein AABX93_00350 [Nanoarchaeota archaeon]